MKAIGYIRVSTTTQADNGISLDAQKDKIKAWCKVNGYRLDTVFSDRGMSAKRADNRPQLQKALKAVCNSRKAAFVVYSLSRLARSTKDAIGIAERLDKAGADLVSLSEKLDTTSAAGKMMFRMLAVLAEFERDLTSERTKTAMAHKRMNGQRIGAIPYGYDLADDGVMLIGNPSEQAVIDEIKIMRKRGMKLQQIAGELSERNIPTKTGNTYWSHQTIALILKRR